MLIKDLTLIGNSHYLLLDKALRDMTGIKGRVQINIENDKIIIQKPIKEKEEK